MNLLKRLLFLFLVCWPACTQAQYKTLPPFVVSQRANTVYMDSLANLAKQQYSILATQPQTALNDTLRFKTLNYLCGLYKWWSGRQDSTLYFGKELVSQARKSRNLFYELNGELVLAVYYRAINTPQALRINFNILDRLPRLEVYDVVRYRVNMNLNDIYSTSKDYKAALYHLLQARQMLVKDLTYAGSVTTNSFRIEVEQRLGATYKQLNNFSESEAHYLAAEKLSVKSSSEYEKAYIYDDLGELYLKEQRYEQALYYAKKAEAIWDRLKPRNESHSWGTLCCVYAGLGQDELAFQYAQKVLQIPRPGKFVLEQAYTALYQLFEHRQDWKNSAMYFKKYIAIRDTIVAGQRSLELSGIQKQAEFDKLTLQSRQAQQLQAERLHHVLEQAELNRLRANAETDALTKKTLLIEQQGLVEKERAQTALARQSIHEKLQRQAYQQQAQKAQWTRSWLTAGLIGALLFTLALGVVFRKNWMQQREIKQLNESLERTVQIRTNELLTANDELRRANRAIQEADARIITAQESERQRIAADLHDDLGGTLATLRRRFTDLRQYLHEPTIVRVFDAIEPLLQKSNADLRRIAHNLMPPEFARIGLRSALEQLVRSQPSQPTRFSFITSGIERKLALDTELNAYRIVSELVQNIGKHAQANQAAVQLLYHDDRLTIIVEDDGLGDQVTVTVDDRGLGLKNSLLRADYIGAKLWRDVSAGGTLVVLDVPYESTSASIQ